MPLRRLLEMPPRFPRPDYQFADIVGTGGDGSNSINYLHRSAFVGGGVWFEGREARQPQRVQPVRFFRSARRIRYLTSI